MTERIVSPEWLVPTRADFAFDDSLKGGWGVSPAPLLRGASFTDFGTHEMSVPTENSDAGRAVRLHEMIHARISPTSVPHELMSQFGVSTEAVRLAEEVRVNFIGRDVGVMIRLGAEVRPHKWSATVGDTFNLEDGTERATAGRAIQNDKWGDALHLYLSTYNTAIHKAVKRKLRTNKEWREPLSVIDAVLKRTHLLSHGGEGDRGISSRRHRFVHDTTPCLFKWVDRTGNKHETFIPQGFLTHTVPLAESIDSWLEHPPTSPRYARGRPSERRSDALDNDWEKLAFGATSLTETTSAFLGRRKRPAMTGKYPTRPDRLLTDPERRIFRESVRAQGGIVVFDCSGSMGVDHDVVSHAVKQFAGATIVVYSHSAGSPFNAWVVARRGRMISREEFDELPLNRGNGVDGPILRWAIRQRKSKEFILWVSDGQVTGKKDAQGEGQLIECAELSAKHNIIGVNTCDEALNLLSDLKKGMPLPRQKFCRLIGRYVNDIKKNGYQFLEGEEK